MMIPAFCVRSSMFENIEPFFLILSLTVRESSSGEKVIKNINRMRLSKQFSKFMLFAFARQSLTKNLTEIHFNRVINYLTRKLRRK
jgi:hypothetical protein